MLRIPRIVTPLQSLINRYPQYIRLAIVATNYNCRQFQVASSFATLKPSLDEDSEIFHGQVEQNVQTWKVDYKQAIRIYPFHHIPIALIRNPDKFDIDPVIKKHLIAFKALSANDKDLQLASKLLLTPEQIESLKKESQKHQQLRIFQYYFQSQIKNMMTLLNNGSGDFEERLMAIVIISQMNGMYFETKGFRILDQRKIVKQDDTGVLTAYYVRYAIRNQSDYIHLLPLLIEKMTGDNTPESKIMIARSIMGTDKFETYYPEKLIDLALSVYTSQLSTIHNYEILFLMRLAYNYNSEAARKFGEAVIKHIKNKHIVEGNIDFHVPMILKAIKYCSKRRLPCEELTDFIQANMIRFKAIFEKKNISKGLLFSLMFSRTKVRDVSEEMLGYLREFFLTTIEEISSADEVEEGELVRVSKLLIRYFDRLSTSQKEHIRQKYIDIIIPQFYQHNQVLFYSILVVLRQKWTKPEDNAKAAKFDRDNQFIKKMIIRYLQSCSENVNGKLSISKHISSATELMYQVNRHELNIPHSRLPSLLAYDFGQKETVGPENVGNFFAYLSNCQEKEEDIKRALQQFQPTLEVYFRKKKIASIHTIYGILNVCSKVNYDHKYLFKHIENGFADYLMRNPNMFIPESDIKFINNKMIKRGYGSPNLKRFINGVLDNPKNWNRLRYDYVQNEKKHSVRLTRERNERQYR